MPSEQIRFWLETIASMVGLFGVFVIAYELDRARKSDAREFLFHTYEKFSAMHKHRVVVENMQVASLDEFILTFKDAEIRESMTAVFNFYDLLTRSVRDKSVDSKIAVEHFGRVFMDFYESFSQYHHQFRDIEGLSSTWFESFDWFAEEYRRHMPGDWEAYEKSNAYVEELYARSD